MDMIILAYFLAALAGLSIPLAVGIVIWYNERKENEEL